jgi:hypothetical protein
MPGRRQVLAQYRGTSQSAHLRECKSEVGDKGTEQFDDEGIENRRSELDEGTVFLDQF